MGALTCWWRESMESIARIGRILSARMDGFGRWWRMWGGFKKGIDCE